MQAAQQHTDGQQAPAEPIRRRISNFLAHWVTRLRIALLVVLVAAAAGLIGYFIYSEVSKKLSSDAALMAEKLGTQYDTWHQETDATKKAALEKDLFDKLNTLISRYPNQYGGQRGLFLRAEAWYEKKTWDSARADYEALAARFPKSYLAPISLFDAAVCAEEKGDPDHALSLYQRAAADYQDSAVAPRALFDAGRLQEGKNDWTGAQKTYQSMDEKYPQSVWTRLAKNRLIELKVLGKIK